MSATKHDNNKSDLSLVPKIAVVKLAEALEVGKKKYSRYNYCAGLEASRVFAALLRHAYSWFDGEEADQDDGQSHLGSVMACAAMILRQQELGTLVDNRYKEAPPQPEKPTKVWRVLCKGRNGAPTSLGCFPDPESAEKMKATFFAKQWPEPAFTLWIEETSDA